MPPPQPWRRSCCAWLQCTSCSMCRPTCRASSSEAACPPAARLVVCAVLVVWAGPGAPPDSDACTDASASCLATFTLTQFTLTPILPFPRCHCCPSTAAAGLTWSAIARWPNTRVPGRASSSSCRSGWRATLPRVSGCLLAFHMLAAGKGRGSALYTCPACRLESCLHASQGGAKD